MIIIKNKKTNAYLESIIDRKENLYHFTEGKEKAMIFSRLKDVPFRFRDKEKWIQIRVGDYTKLYNDQKGTVYQISKDTGIPVSNLYEYCAGRKDINNMPIRVLKLIAKQQGLTVDKLNKKMEQYVANNLTKDTK
jgi:hypothetical protein